LAASCTAPAERAVRRADAAIQRRCTDAVGEGLPASTCAPFPACQTEFDVTTGQRLAATAYQVEGEIEEPTKCGDGIIDSDQSEICDDGNTVPSDACTDTCKPAVCSDGIVWEGMEICDDANSVDDDCCSNDCQTAARCGDGVAQLGCGEECDDPNDPGCRDCRFVPFACDGSGLVATIAVRYDLSTSIPGDGLGGAKVRIDYPAALGIATLEGTPLVDPSRLRNVGDSRASLFARTGDENSDAAPDITLLYALPGRPGFAAGDIVDVQFDCAAGTSVVTRDLTCAVLQASDVFGNAIFSTPELTSQSIPCQVTQTRLASAVSP
jgi:cysteine-rich repeat protein